MIASIDLPVTGAGDWTRYGWNGHVEPGESFEAIPLGRDPVSVLVHLADTPPGAAVHFEVSPTGRGRWTRLEAAPEPFFKNRPGDTYELMPLKGHFRPVLEAKETGRVSISVTVMPQGKTRMTGEAVA